MADETMDDLLGESSAGPAAAPVADVPTDVVEPLVLIPTFHEDVVDIPTPVFTQARIHNLNAWRGQPAGPPPYRYR